MADKCSPKGFQEKCETLEDTVLEALVYLMKARVCR